MMMLLLFFDVNVDVATFVVVDVGVALDADVVVVVVHVAASAPTAATANVDDAADFYDEAGDGVGDGVGVAANVVVVDVAADATTVVATVVVVVVVAIVVLGVVDVASLKISSYTNTPTPPLEHLQILLLIGTLVIGALLTTTCIGLMQGWKVNLYKHKCQLNLQWKSYKAWTNRQQTVYTTCKTTITIM